MLRKKMQATFGRLKNETLELKSGLNIVEAPNEAGKSTWSAFIRSMLYGVNTSERDSAQKIADKNRFQPWDGGAMSGTMELEARGKDITLSRAPLGKQPFRNFSAVYTGSAEAVDWLSAASAGEELTGVNENVFTRTAFIRQAGEISDARKGLGVSGKKGPFSKLRDGGHVFSVLVSRSLENAVVTADSMKSRGYGLPGRTAFSRYRFTGADGALLSFVLALTAFVGWCGVKKAFSYSFYPTAGALILSPLGWIGLGAYFVLCLLPTAITIREEWKWKHIRSEI